MWWDILQVHGASFGYRPNASKTNLMVKAEHVGRSRKLFADTDINITTEGKQHLGSYTEEYVAGKVAKWSKEIKKSWYILPRHSPMQLTAPSLMVFLATGPFCYEPFLI